jgi:hypothetical protein
MAPKSSQEGGSAFQGKPQRKGVLAAACLLERDHPATSIQFFKKLQNEADVQSKATIL